MYFTTWSEAKLHLHNMYTKTSLIRQISVIHNFNLSNSKMFILT